MRLDTFLRNAGVIPRRSRAKEACEEGLVTIDGKIAKPSAEVRPGQKLKVELDMQVREYEVLDLPRVPVAKKQRENYAKLLMQSRVDTDEW